MRHSKPTQPRDKGRAPARRPAETRATPFRAPRQPRRTEATTAREGERLQKVLAAAGIASRRAAEALIDEGRVTVDGHVVRVQGMRVDPGAARIEVDGERINVSPVHHYFMLNKPVGYVTTAADPQGRRVVLDLVKTKHRIYAVGRLDVDTFGLLLLTNNGELAHRLTHPRYEIPRTYIAEVRGAVGRAALERLKAGVALDDGPARAKSARVVHATSGRTQVELTLTEGRKHEVRRMFEVLGNPVLNLVRTRYGPVRLGDLAIGSSRRLTPQEIGALLTAVGL